MTIAGHAGPVVLESYDGERRKQHAALDAQQTTGFRRIVYRSRIGDAALDAAGALVPNLGSKLFGSNDLQQLSVAYPDSQLSEEHLRLRQLLKRGVPQAGDRAPDAELIAWDGRTTTLFPLLYNAEGRSWGWNLLAFDGSDPVAAKALRSTSASLASWIFIRTTLVVSSPAAMTEEAVSRDSLSDLDGAAHAAYGLEGTPALVLVRPDGHIAFRGPATSPEKLLRYCEKTFAQPSKETGE
jgi:hypothetical protein